MLRTVFVSALVSVTLAVLPAWGTTFDRFVAQIAVDDGCKGRSGESIFRVELDGKEVFKSRVFLPGDDPEPIDIPLGEAKTLSLIIDDEGDGHGGDWGDYLDARLVDSKTGEFMFLTDLDPEQVQEWIAPNKDRNIIEQKIAINDTVYLRGWGGLSGSHNRFRDWNEIAAKQEAALDQANVEAAARTGELQLAGVNPLPAGLKLVLDGTELTDRELKKGVALKPTSRLVVTTDLANADHTAWWKGGGCSVSAGGKTIPLVDLVQPSERLVQTDVQPNHNVLVGDAPPETQGYWVGKPVPAPGAMTFTLRDLAVAFERAQFKHQEGQILLLVRAKQYKTTEVPNAAAITSARLTVEIDGTPVAYVFSDNPASWDQAIALAQWPGRLECLTDPGADGSMGDGFAIDFGLRSPEAKEPLWIRSIQPTMQIFEYQEPKQLLVAAAWRIPGQGIVRWDGLGDELARRKAGADALDAAKEKLALDDYRKQVENSIATALQLNPGLYERQIKALAAELIRKDPNLRDRIDAVTDEVLKNDPRQPDIRIAAAERLRELGNLLQERRQWGLLIEVCRADLDLMIRARARIDAIWDEADPEPFPYPDDGSPTRTSRALGNTWTGAGDVYNHVWTVELSKDNNWTAELALPNERVGHLAVMVNSRGIEVTATLADTKPLATKTTQHPFLDVNLVETGESPAPLTLTISQDPDVTGIILPHTVEVIAWQISSQADIPTEDWQIAIRKDGTATVSRTSRAPVLAAIPRSATNLVVEGCTGYTVQEPITEYLVEWDGRLGGASLPLFVAPKPGEQIRISYEWPEAAYNVPMSKYGWDRRDHVYLGSPNGILDTKASSTWRITDVPKEWKNERWTPLPTNETQLVFHVSPKGRLEAVWKADGVLTRWIAVEYRGLVAYVPDSPNNRRWFPFYMNYVRMIYDKQIQVTGHERPYELFVGVQGASMLSGYGGGTAGDEHGAETWIPSSHRMSPCEWRHGRNPCGVDSHELHWVTLASMVQDLPQWADKGFVIWVEEIGWRVTDLGDAGYWPRRHTANALALLEQAKQMGSNPVQLAPEEYGNQPEDLRLKMDGLCWYITDQIAKAYGDDFWSRFYADQRRLYADVYPVLSNQAKQILFVNELVRISGDEKLRQRFTDEWLFNLTPDPQDAADRTLILPRQPKVMMVSAEQDSPGLAALDFNDLAWPVVAESRQWENRGPGPWGEKVTELRGQGGTVWYRFTFDVPADFKTDDLELRLGKINAADETYFNGTKVGATGAFPPEFKEAAGEERTYAVPAELLKPGARNVVAIRVYCESDGGGPERRPVLVSGIKKAE